MFKHICKTSKLPPCILGILKSTAHTLLFELLQSFWIVYTSHWNYFIRKRNSKQRSKIILYIPTIDALNNTLLFYAEQKILHYIEKEHCCPSSIRSLYWLYRLFHLWVAFQSVFDTIPPEFFLDVNPPNERIISVILRLMSSNDGRSSGLLFHNKRLSLVHSQSIYVAWTFQKRLLHVKSSKK